MFSQGTQDHLVKADIKHDGAPLGNRPSMPDKEGADRKRNKHAQRDCDRRQSDPQAEMSEPPRR